MNIRQRLRIGFGLLFGRRYGIIVDTDYANGGKVSDFEICGCHQGIRIVGRSGACIAVENNRLKTLG